jgi:Fe-Mn family superoxide dismutase
VGLDEESRHGRLTCLRNLLISAREVLDHDGSATLFRQHTFLFSRPLEKDITITRAVVVKQKTIIDSVPLLSQDQSSQQPKFDSLVPIQNNPNINKKQPNLKATMSYTLPSLGYSYAALEPHFDAETMEIHHARHHQTYITNLNAALAPHTNLSSLAIDSLITNLDAVPEDIRRTVRNQGGGHANHSFFWRGLKTGTELKGALKEGIERDYGSLEAFREEFEGKAKGVFGSGWVWLVVSAQGGGLKVVTTKDQDSPLMGESVVGEAAGWPVLGLDVWEHAYYLKYRNKRPDYIKAFWSVVDWEEGGRRFEQSGKGGKL